MLETERTLLVRSGGHDDAHAGELAERSRCCPDAAATAVDEHGLALLRFGELKDRQKDREEDLWNAAASSSEIGRRDVIADPASTTTSSA